MKKIIYSIFFLMIATTAMAQPPKTTKTPSKAETEKMIQQTQELLKKLPPEALSQMKKGQTQIPAAGTKQNKNDLKNNGFFNYTVDGKETKTLQYDIRNAAFVKTVSKKGNKTFDLPVTLCVIDGNELKFGSGGDPSKMKGNIYMYLKIKNPGKGTNLLNCDDPEQTYRNKGRVMMSFGSSVQEASTNSNYRRKPSGVNGCEGSDDCETVELIITEFNSRDGGKVSGYFSGNVFEDKDEFSKNCESSIKHAVSGNFSLIITNADKK